MQKVTLTGQDKVIEALNKWAQVEVMIRSWMKSGQPDEIMQKSFTQNFASQGRPKWSKLADSTLADRKKKGYSPSPILVRTGNLRDEVTSLTGKVTTAGRSMQMVWGIDQIRDKGKFASHQAGIRNPQRQMIGFQKIDATRLGRSLREFILMQLK